MKWSWDANKTAEWRNAKRRELETRLGVPISVYTAHGKVNFLPYLKCRAVQSVDAPTLEAQLLHQIEKTKCTTFAALYETGWHFDDLFAVALTVIRKELAKPDVDRMGNIVGLHK